jgi:hypothetical protein
MDILMLIVTHAPNYVGFIVAIYILLSNNRDLHNRIDSLEAKLDRHFNGENENVFPAKEK